MKTHRTGASKIWHWLVAVPVLGMLGFGFYLRYVSDPPALIDLHRAIGVAVLLTASARVLWWIAERRLLDSSINPAWLRYAVASVHLFLLFATLAMPLSGLAMTLGHGDAISVFGMFSIGPLPEPVHWLANLGSSLHAKLGKLLTLVLALHVAGALKQPLLRVVRRLRAGNDLPAGSSPA